MDEIQTPPAEQASPEALPAAIPEPEPRPRRAARSEPVAATEPALEAVRCEIPGGGYYPQGDPKVGHYAAHRVYLVGRDLTIEKAQALLDGGQFVAVPAREATPDPVE